MIVLGATGASDLKHTILAVPHSKLLHMPPVLLQSSDNLPIQGLMFLSRQKEMKTMRRELLEETIQLEIARQAERFGVNYSGLSPNVQSWLRSLVIEQIYGKDAAPAVSPEADEEE